MKIESDKDAKQELVRLIDRVQDGQADAENRLAKQFLALALARLSPQTLNGLQESDQEDIALSAVRSFCIGIREGRYQYEGDKQLFSLLHKIIDGKIRKLWQYHFAQKRDIRSRSDADVKEIGDKIQVGLPADSIHVTPEEQPAVERILEDLQSELHGVFVSLLASLDEHPRKLLLTLLETDASNEELAQQIGRSVASVERYRMLIRSKIEQLHD